MRCGKSKADLLSLCATAEAELTPKRDREHPRTRFFRTLQNEVDAEDHEENISSPSNTESLRDREKHADRRKSFKDTVRERKKRKRESRWGPWEALSFLVNNLFPEVRWPGRGVQAALCHSRCPMLVELPKIYVHT